MCIGRFDRVRCCRCWCCARAHGAGGGGRGGHVEGQGQGEIVDTRARTRWDEVLAAAAAAGYRTGCIRHEEGVRSGIPTRESIPAALTGLVI